MISCGEARRLAWPDPAPRALDDATASAQAHIADCAACQVFVADMRAMADGLAARAPRPRAPHDVRERVFAGIARARSERVAGRVQRLKTFRVIVAAAVLFVLSSVLVSRWMGQHTTASDRLAQLAADHGRVSAGESLLASDTAAVARWLERRVDFAVHVPRFEGSDLLGARVYDLDTSRGVVIEYRVEGRRVSYYIMPSKPRGSSGPNAREREPVVRLATRAGFRIAFWEEPGLSHAIVGDLPPARVAALAHECIQQMMA